MKYYKLENPVVVIFCHSRSALLEVSIKSFLSAEDSENWKLVVVQQVGYPDVDSVLEKYSGAINYLHKFSPVSKHYLANINHSRLTGWEIAFKTYQSNFVIGVEEDTSIARDCLIFSRFIFGRYGGNRKFRGINYTSFLAQDHKLLHSFTLRRFGLSGQCGGLPKSTWDKFDQNCLRKLGSNEEWASHIEPIMRTGFTIFPNQSRALDQGWGGTSKPDGKPSEEYFVRHAESYVGDHSCQEVFLRLEGWADVWRADAILYKPYQNIYFILRERKFLQKIYKVLRWLGFPNIKEIIHSKRFHSKF